MYSEAEIPREILVPANPPDHDAVVELLSESKGVPGRRPDPAAR